MSFKPLHFTLLCVLTLSIGCATKIKKHRFDSSVSSTEALDQVQTAQKQAKNLQSDLLAKKIYQNGLEALEEAQESLNKNEPKGVLNNAGFAISYFDKAKNKSITNAKNYKALLQARQTVLDTGAPNYQKFSNILEEIDEDFADESDNFKRELSASKSSNIQQRYLELEKSTVVGKELGWAISTLNKRKEKNNADHLAPKSHQQAKTDVLQAKNLIKQSPRNSSIYSDKVQKANQSTWMLDEVMKIIVANPGTPENVAKNQVKNEQKISSYQDKVKAYQNGLALQGFAIQDQQDQLNQQRGQIAKHRSTIKDQNKKLSFQESMENIRQDLSGENVEAYQQGNKLIVRLGDLGFPVGKSKIPAQSEDMLIKIANIVSSTEANSITVEGHTDSTGPKDFNKKLSQDRAQSVKEFLNSNGVETVIKSEGFASSRPLANNKSRANRAKNRRVDIVIEREAPSNLY